MDKVLASSISVVVVNGADWTVDRQLFKVGSAVAVDLSIEVRKDTALQKRVFCEVDASDDVSGLKLRQVSCARTL